MVYQRAEDKKGRYPVVNQYLYYPDGTLKEAIGGEIAYHYDYTVHGLLQKKSSAKTPLLEYAYDKNRNIVQRTDITSNHTHYTYNALNRLEQVTKENGELLASYRYTIAGQMEQLCYGNGVKTNYCYRDDGKPERLVTITPQGEVFLNYEYVYDGNGNCIKKSGQRYQNEYTYDKKNQLKTASYNGRWETYTYDNVGNRIQKETLEKQYADKFGVNKGKIILVALTPKWNRGVNGEKIIGEGVNLNSRIENELMNIVGANNKKSANANATVEEVWKAHKKVYESIGHKDWAIAIYRAYVTKRGIKY